ncbi:late embryogenesis abundant protein 7-like [Rhododendron vialii]|uniref:late embryogenesis abundant protein 7-like n=1 Tax=Rhododendron vialii TaxID=182163 RepID=UPI00265E14BF|nr:late embryogenesis abundant protein 7-like [Rhododendron vialii]
MSSAQQKAGQAQGQAKAKTQEWVQTAQSTANKACDKAADSKEEAQQGKEQSAGIIQQTGEQVMNMAQGAIDGVKSTLGINENTHHEKK